ncbi:MAG TPA: STAS domain-containing protein [Sporichthyaceae bacterium]|jgi:anti-anti-sigma factor
MVTSESRLAPMGEGLWARTLPDGLMLFGDLDVVSEQSFRRAVSARARRDRGSLVVDVTQLNFLDGRGLAALFGLVEDHVDFSLRVRAGSLVDRVVQISGLEQVIRIERIPA